MSLFFHTVESGDGISGLTGEGESLLLASLRIKVLFGSKSSLLSTWLESLDLYRGF